MAEPRCSVVIPVHNKAALTQQCLESLFEHRPEVPFEIVVVDDASTDTTQEILAAFGDSVRSVRLEKNAGFATACNTGAAASDTEHILFLNNDTLAKPGWLDALVDYADANPHVSVVGSKLLYPDETIQHAGVVFSLTADPLHLYAGVHADHPAVNKSRAFQVVTGASLLIRRSAFDEAEGFDTAYHNDLEDVDMCLRLGVLGHEIHYCHESVLYHLESVSRGRRTSWPSAKVYGRRWKGRVRHDELDYYLEDGFLDLFRVSSEQFKEKELQREAELFRLRLWQVALLLRERVRVTTEISLGRNGARSPRSRRSAKARTGNGLFPRRRPLSKGSRLRSPLKAHHVPVQRLEGWLASEITHLHPDPSGYSEIRSALPEDVRRNVPAGSTVLVVSKGDDRLLELPGCRGWHFPRAEDGQYRGYYPASTGEAIRHMAELRSEGARYLVFPSTALWWLDHYEGLRQYLLEDHRRVAHTPSCLIFELREMPDTEDGETENGNVASADGQSQGLGYTAPQGEVATETVEEGTSSSSGVETAGDASTGSLTSPEYDDLTARIREVARLVVPAGATAVVLSRGDDGLLELPGLRGWHFPREEDGRYLGYYPADSQGAIEHLEDLRSRGAEYLVFPGTAFWWFDHYERFGQHIRARYSLVGDKEDVCRIFHLVENPFFSIVRRLVPQEAKMAVLEETEEGLAAGLDEHPEYLIPAQDDGQAIASLEELQRKGVQVLIVPHSAFGWLDRHERFTHALRSGNRLVTRQNVCEIYELSEAPESIDIVGTERGTTPSLGRLTRALARPFRLLSKRNTDTDA
jgi:GT2 family glycosyltransferase